MNLFDIFKKRSSPSPEQRLMRAAESGDIETAKQVLDEHPEAVNANKQHAFKATPLMWAASSGRKEICALLLDRGAELEKQDAEGCTAFFYLANGMIRGSATLDPDPSARFDPLDHEATGKLLIARGADPNARSGNGQTPLSRTIWGFDHAAVFLLDCGADIEARDAQGWTLLMRAAAGKSEKIVKVLLEKGASVLAQNPEGKNALTLAEESDSFRDAPQQGATLALLWAAFVTQQRAAEAAEKERVARAVDRSVVVQQPVSVRAPLKLTKK